MPFLHFCLPLLLEHQSFCYCFLLFDLSIWIASNHLVRESQELPRHLLRKKCSCASCARIDMAAVNEQALRKLDPPS